MKRRDCLSALAALAVALRAPLAAAHAGAHPPPRRGYARSTADYTVPDARLVDMDGSPLDLRAALGGAEPVMLNFVFTSCRAICPVMSATFAQVQERVSREGGRLRLVSVSIDPEHDTPARLREYARRFGARPGWRFLTGTAEASLAVQRAFDVYRGEKMSHDPVTLLRSGAGAKWVRLDGFADAGELVEEYRRIARP